ncbi:MAG: DUF3800 domain-containing protein [candidate division Zixibacteria bacterium]|nr:DUF3800 domain-containing protein [candidate division Zixibacteria bacterium]
MKYNVYCDESCHLENDGSEIMVLGAVWCPADTVSAAFTRIGEIKAKHGVKSNTEVKWTKVAPNKEQMYLDLLDFFFDDDSLHFRALIVSQKSKLSHDRFEQDHDTWYYKMYFTMLQAILTRNDQYRIYLDIKDTLGPAKIRKLREVLATNMKDYDSSVVRRMQTVRSNEVQLIQMADILSGAVCYANRNLCGSKAKLAMVNRMRHRSGYDLTKTTFLREAKANLFVWSPQE